MKDRSKHLLRLALADQAFREADAIAEHILVTKIEPGGHLYHASVAGLATSYCRPFMSATGLGRISPEFEVFTKTEDPPFFTQVHLDLFTARDKIAAHFDLDYGEGEFRQRKYTLHPGEVELQLERKGFYVRTNHTTLAPQRVAHARLLVAIQLKRILDAQSDFAISIIRETRGKLGSYVFAPKKKSA